MPYETIKFEISAGVASLTLHRPESLNSINRTMHAELRDALAEIKRNSSVRALLLTGSGRGFCAGQDLNERRASSETADLGESLEQRYNPLIRSLRRLEIPVICAVNGTAAGAGANLALACDIVLAARSASFIQSFSRIGLIPDCGGTWLLPRLVGSARAMALALLGDRIDAARAEQMGMIWQAVDDAALLDEARQLAHDLARRPTRGLALIKRALQQSADNSLDQQLDLERDLQQLAGRTADYREGVAAFMDKREPNFQGR